MISYTQLKIGHILSTRDGLIILLTRSLNDDLHLKAWEALILADFYDDHGGAVGQICPFYISLDDYWDIIQ